MADTTVIDRLKSQLLTSGLSQKDNALFQIINQLIDSLRVALEVTNAITASSGSGGVGTQSFVTYSNEIGSLPNSRQITPGQGISFRLTNSRLFIDSTGLTSGARGSNQEETVRNIIALGSPGPRGLQGIQGPQGIPGRDSESTDRYIPVPSPTGIGQLVLLKGFTVAGLPPTPPPFTMAAATDLLLPAFLAVAVGGGAVIGPVFFNGTNWITI